MRKDLMGCYMSFEKDKDGNEVPFITSQFEPNYARTCIPTFDEPDIKMIFDVTVSVPNSMDVYFNTEPLTSEVVTIISDEHSSRSLSSVHSLDSYKRVHFMETPVMSAYLLAFAAGSYSSITSITEHSIPVSLIFPSCSLFQFFSF